MKDLIRLSLYVRRQWVILLFAFLYLDVSIVSILVVPRILVQGINAALGSGLRSNVVTTAVIIMVTATLS